MAIIEIKQGLFKVTYSKRHPKTKAPRGLSRTHYIDSHGRKQPITTIIQARKVEKVLVLELEKSFKKVRVPTWSKLLEKFQPYYESTGVTASTAENYVICLKKHSKEWMDISSDEITGNMIRIVINRVGEKKSISHQKNILKFVRTVFKYALEAGYIQTDPTPVMKFRIGDKIMKVLKEDEIRKLLNVAKTSNYEWYPHWFTALYTGMRNCELYALKWENVDLDSKVIHVKVGWTKKNGFKGTKSGDERIIPIADDLLNLFKQLKLSMHDPEFVLPRHSLWDKGEQARVLRAFLVGIQLPPVRFHDLRACWATLLLSKNVPPVKVMSIGGWKDMKTMMKYIRKAGIDIKGVTNCLELQNPNESIGKLYSLEKSAL